MHCFFLSICFLVSYGVGYSFSIYNVWLSLDIFFFSYIAITSDKWLQYSKNKYINKWVTCLLFQILTGNFWAVLKYGWKMWPRNIRFNDNLYYIAHICMSVAFLNAVHMPINRTLLLKTTIKHYKSCISFFFYCLDGVENRDLDILISASAAASTMIYCDLIMSI